MKRGRNGKPLFGLYRSRMPVAHREAHDIDYADRLSDEDAEWLSKFMEEYLHSRFTGDADLHPDRRVTYNDSNARRRDITTVSRAKNVLASWSRYPSPDGSDYCLDDWYANQDPLTVEDRMLQQLDMKLAGVTPEDALSCREDALQAAEGLLWGWDSLEALESLREAARALRGEMLEIEIFPSLLEDIDAEQEWEDSCG